jgi:hypothetical protein
MSHATVPTVRVLPSHPSQGDFVEINASDFDAAVHTLYTASLPPSPLPPLSPPPGPPPHPLANLPKNWREKPPGELRMLAESVTGRTPENRAQAIALIEQSIPE